MSFLSEADRTTILLETIEDASVHVGELGGKLTESMANRLRTAFGMVLAAAKRHPEYPKESKPTVVTPWVPTPGSQDEKLPPTSDQEVPF